MKVCVMGRLLGVERLNLKKRLIIIGTMNSSESAKLPTKQSLKKLTAKKLSRSTLTKVEIQRSSRTSKKPMSPLTTPRSAQPTTSMVKMPSRKVGQAQDLRTCSIPCSTRHQRDQKRPSL